MFTKALMHKKHCYRKIRSQKRAGQRHCIVAKASQG